MSAPSASRRNTFNLHLTFFRNINGFIRTYFREGLPLNRLIINLKRYKDVWYLHEMEIEEFFLYRIWNEKWNKERYAAFIGWKKHILSLVALNPIQYRCLTENKLVFYTYCKAMGVPTPEVYAIYNPHSTDIEDFTIIKNVEGLIEFLELKNITEFVLKPTEGTRGQAVHVLKYDAKTKQFNSISGDPVTIEDLNNALEKYNYRGSSQTSFMIQKRLEPHDSTKEFSPFVPFSYRVLTILDENNEPHIIDYYAKASEGKSITDNWESGGMSLSLDENGVCTLVTNKQSIYDDLQYHSTSNFKFTGWQAPFFREVRTLGIKAAKAFPYARCVAWDIILAKDGIYVIEGNNPWSVEQQLDNFKGLWQGVFAEEAGNAIKHGPKKSPWW